MSRILRISQSDYRIRVQDGGTITLDTGIDHGTVLITGDLVVQGETTTVNTTNMSIEDNIIILNKGETGADGITSNVDGARSSGLRIDRGQIYRETEGDLTPSPYDAMFVFDEEVTHYDPLLTETPNVNGTFVLRTNDGTLTGLQTNSITTAGLTDLVFDLQDGTNVIRIVNNDPLAYANRLLTDVAESPDHDNDIPNRLFVTSYVNSGVVVPGMADVDRIYKAVGGVEQTRAQAYNDSIRFFVDITERAKINDTGLYVDYVNVFGNTVKTTVTNLVLTATNHNVEVDAVLNLKKQAPEFAPPVTDGSGTLTKIYTNTTPILSPEPNYTPGQTGMYFTNTLNTDELIAKNRALLFSMIF